VNRTTAVYVRVSSSDQRPDSQQRELKRYCQQRKWNNAEFYCDRLSGVKASRPELDRMVGDMRAGKVERLVVYKLDRLGRSLTHLSLLLDEMSRLSLPLVCTSQGIDTSDSKPLRQVPDRRAEGRSGVREEPDSRAGEQTAWRRPRLVV